MCPSLWKRDWELRCECVQAKAFNSSNDDDDDNGRLSLAAIRTIASAATITFDLTLINASDFVVVVVRIKIKY